MSWMHACVFSCSLILNKTEIIHVKLQLTAYNVQCTQRDVVVDVEGPSVGLGLQLFNQSFGLSCEDLHEIFQNLEVECGRQHLPVRVPLDACGRARRKVFTSRLETTVAHKAQGFRSEALCTFSFYLRTWPGPPPARVGRACSPSSCRCASSCWESSAGKGTAIFVIASFFQTSCTRPKYIIDSSTVIFVLITR